MPSAAPERIDAEGRVEPLHMSTPAKLLLPAAALVAAGAVFLVLSSGGGSVPLDLQGGRGAATSDVGRSSTPEADLVDVPGDQGEARSVAEADIEARDGDGPSGVAMAAFGVDVTVSPAPDSEGAPSGQLVIVERSALGEGAMGELAHRAASEAPVEARFDLSPDGRARIEVPAGFVSPVLALTDRNWYAPNPIELTDVSSGAVELEVRRGACLVLRPTVSQGELVGTLTVSGFSMRRGGGSGRLDFDLVAGEEILVRGLDPAQAWTVAPEAEAHHCAMKSGVEIAAGGERVLDLAFVPGATIAGRVVDESGDGVEGVDIGTASRMPWMGSAGARRTTTASDGSFLLKGIAPGEVQLEAKLEGWRDAEIESMELADLERIDGMRVVMTRGASITGVVLWEDGTPAAGARVRATRVSRAQWGGWGGGRVQTAASAEADADGAFTLGGLDDGQYTVRASHRPADVADDESAPRWRADLPARAGESVELTLVGPATITGLVIDDRGEPVPEFEVVAQPAESGVRAERASFTSDEGRFSFARIGTGEWTLEARAEHMIPAGGVEVALPGEAGELTLRLDRAATVTGRVTDPSGAPVAGADVRVEESSGGRGGWGGDRARFRARSGEDGAFLLEDLPPTTTTLVVRAEGWADSAPVTFDLAPAEQRDGVALALREGGRVVGAVYDPAGDPLANQRVTYGSNAMGFGSRGETRTGADGSFAFERVTPGTWTVSASPSMEEMSDRMNEAGGNFASIMGELVAETIDVADGATVEVYLGGEPRIPVTISGVVTRGGEPIADAEVYATSEGSAIFEGMKSSRTDAEGAYTLTVDRPGAYLVSARDGDAGVEVAADVPRADSIEIDLAIPDTLLRGRVRRPDGEPAPGIRVTVQREDGLGRIRWSGDQATTDDEGRWDIPGLEPGVYTVRANTSSWQGRSEKRWGKALRKGVTLDENATVDGIDFELEQAGTIAGRVIGADGQPLGGASIFLRDASGAFVDTVSGDVTNAAGDFEAAGLAPGAYTVSVRSAGFASNDTASCTVRSDETVEVELAVEAGAMVDVEVVDAEGEPLRGRVEVFDRDDREVGSPRTIAQVQRQFNAGVSTFQSEVGPLPPGRYTVRVTAADGRTGKKRLTVRASDERKRAKVKIKD